MNTRVWLMRHAETAIPTVFHGAESDIGLSERGARAVAALARKLPGWGITAMYSSGMRRALETARPLADACGLALRVEPALHERRVGILGGLPNRPEPPLWTQTLREWTTGNLQFTTEGAESFAEIHNRVVPIWRRLVAEHRGQSIFVVAHGLLLKVLMLSVVPDWPVSRWSEFGPIPNLAISELLFENDVWRLTSRCRVPDVVRSTFEGSPT